MRVQLPPAIATWLSKLFCSKAEDQSLVGDLLEKYQHRPERLSGIPAIFLIEILGGVIVRALLFLIGNGINESGKSRVLLPTDDSVSKRPSISIHHIPVEGAVGLLFAVGTMVIFGTGVAAIRQIFFLQPRWDFLPSWICVGAGAIR